MYPCLSWTLGEVSLAAPTPRNAVWFRRGLGRHRNAPAGARGPFSAVAWWVHGGGSRPSCPLPPACTLLSPRAPRPALISLSSSPPLVSGSQPAPGRGPAVPPAGRDESGALCLGAHAALPAPDLVLGGAQGGSRARTLPRTRVPGRRAGTHCPLQVLLAGGALLTRPEPLGVHPACPVSSAGRAQAGAWHPGVRGAGGVRFRLR